VGDKSGELIEEEVPVFGTSGLESLRLVKVRLF